KDKMKEYAIKGLKQLKIEYNSRIESLHVRVLFYAIFFITRKVHPMIIRYILLNVKYIYTYMKFVCPITILCLFKYTIYCKKIIILVYEDCEKCLKYSGEFKTVCFCCC